MADGDRQEEQPEAGQHAPVDQADGGGNAERETPASEGASTEERKTE